MSFVSIMELVTMLLAIGKDIFGLVISVEKQLKDVPGTGSAKLEAVSGIVMAAVNEGAAELTAKVGADKLNSFVQKAAGVAVTLFNKTGLFRTTSK